MNAWARLLLVAACVPLATNFKPADGDIAPICGTCMMGNFGGQEEADPIVVGGRKPLSLEGLDADAIGTVRVFRSKSPARMGARRVLDYPFNKKGKGDSDLQSEWNDTQLTLTEFAEGITRVHGINVTCDLAQLEPDDITLKVPWMADDHVAKLGTVLSNLLRYRASTPEPLAFMIDDSGLVISYLDTVEKVGTSFAIYDTSTLPEMSARELEDIVMDSSGGLWVTNDAEGGTLSVRSNGYLLVRHTYDVQRRVHEALNVLATARARMESDIDVDPNRPNSDGSE